MISEQTSNRHWLLQLLVHVVSSALPVMFFFYIDEGYFTFNWMSEPGAWIPFTFYTGIYLAVQFSLRATLPKRYSSWDRTFWASFIGTLGLTILFWWLFS